MGSNNKKNKSSKEVKKRRHRSRSRSSSEDSLREKEKDRHRHKKHHKERRYERTSKHHDYDHENADSDVSLSPKYSKNDNPVVQQQNDSDTGGGNDTEFTNQQSVDSLSIEETNKLRAKLGLKPLEINTGKNESSTKSHDSASANDGKIKDDLGEFYHKPASNLAEKTDQEKLRSKLKERKDKRNIENKLAHVKTLGESDSEEDVESWVEKNRRLQFEKEQAAKRAKMLEELDEEFGVGDIIESETKIKKAKIYSEKSLKGLTVEHNVNNFAEGKSVILTLKDQDVLADNSDVLVNIKMLDDERYQKSNENKKKKSLYQPYAGEEFDENGELIEKSLLSKYDEEIDGVKKSTFVIGETKSDPKKSVVQSIRDKLANKRLESLVLPELTLASEYYTEEELTKFKKPKKKKIKKLRSKGRILTAAELAAQAENVESENDHGSRNPKKFDEYEDDSSTNPTQTSSKGYFTDWTMDIDISESEINKQSKMGVTLKLEPDDPNLDRALNKVKRLKQKETITLPPIESLIKSEVQDDLSANTSNTFNIADSGPIVLNATAEFCRSLGDIPTYGRAGNREEEEELLDFDKELNNSEPTSSWNEIDTNAASTTTESTTKDKIKIETPILDEEPDVGSGVGAALRLALSKGYLDKEENNRPSTSKFAHLQARHYSIEDKTYGDEEKFGGRRERYSGPTMDFKEKDNFRPNVKLEYIDDEGHVLNPKEAFRYLSHKFHGKGPGKNKIEKRIKKTEQEGLMKKMSSTDTPLGTLNMLQHKQKEMQSPYIVLSGSKHTHSTTISKIRR